MERIERERNNCKQFLDILKNGKSEENRREEMDTATRWET